MSFRSQHDSIRIRVGRYDSNQFKAPRKTVFVDPCKSPSELIFFREAFKLIDSKRGTTFKRQYTNLIGQYQRGTIPWECISGFDSGYKAAVVRVCRKLEDLFRNGDINTPTIIHLLASYAYKVYRFRQDEVDQRCDYDYDDRRRGHQGACDIWYDAYSRLHSLEMKISSFCASKIVQPSVNVTTTPEPQAVQPPSELEQLPDGKIAEAESTTLPSPVPEAVEEEPAKVSIWWQILSCICCIKPKDKKKDTDVNV